MTMWQPGMRCVCIETPVVELDDLKIPQKGSVYTVRKSLPAEDARNLEGHTVLWLAELDNAHTVGWVVYSKALRGNARLTGEPGWSAEHFRPLAETRLDQFRKHLNRIPTDRVPA